MAKKKTKKQKQNKNNQIAIIILAIILLTVGAAYFLSMNETTQSTEEHEQQVLAKVNNHSITLKDVKRTKETIDLQTQGNISRDEALERAITDRIILKKAEEENLSLTTQEAEKYLEKEISIIGKSLSDIKQALIENNKNYEEEIEIYRQQMTIQKFINQKIPAENITEQEAKEYYEQNKDRLFTGAVVPYEQIAAQLKQGIAQQKQQKRLTEYLTELRENNEVFYMDEEN